MAFRVGQRVTMKEPPCNPDSPIYGEAFPEFGKVYTVRDVVSYIDGAGLRFAEIRNQANQYREGYLEVTFDAEAFRPVVERKTDISIFEKMLTGGKQPARV